MQSWENIAKVGTIVEIHSEHKALAKIKVSSRISDFLPIIMFANSFKRKWEPIRVGEQVTIISPFGDASYGLVIRGVFNSDCKEPQGASDTCEVVEYEDGTRFSYDTSSKLLLVDAVGDITIKAGGNLKFDVAGSIDIASGDTTTIKVPKLSILKN